MISNITDWPRFLIWILLHVQWKKQSLATRRCELKSSDSTEVKGSHFQLNLTKKLLGTMRELLSTVHRDWWEKHNWFPPSFLLLLRNLKLVIWTANGELIYPGSKHQIWVAQFSSVFCLERLSGVMEISFTTQFPSSDKDGTK